MRSLREDDETRDREVKRELLVQLFVLLHSCRAFVRYQRYYGNDWSCANVGQIEDVWRRVREKYA